MARAKKKQLVESVTITSRGKRIGSIEPEQFRKSTSCPRTHFLGDCIKEWNDWKAQIGEPERASIEWGLNGLGRARRAAKKKRSK